MPDWPDLTLNNPGMVSPSSFNTRGFCPADSCGSRPNTRIVGGTQAPRHSWPWQVQLRSSGRFPFCGGSLVHPRWVVSATHCLVGKSPTSFNIRYPLRARNRARNWEKCSAASPVWRWCLSKVQSRFLDWPAKQAFRIDHTGIRWVLTARELGRAQKIDGRGGRQELPSPPPPLPGPFFCARPNSHAVKIRKLGDYPYLSTWNACFTRYF